MPLCPADQTLFVVDIEYTVPVEAVDPLVDAHMAFVDDGYAAGFFLATGPKVPRTGGVILATAPNKAELDAFLTRDPFQQNAVARYIVTEFQARRVADGLD